MAISAMASGVMKRLPSTFTVIRSEWYSSVVGSTLRANRRTAFSL